MADLRPQYNEEVVGHGHPTKTDVTNRAWNVEHEEDGTHKDDIIDSDQYVDGSIDKVHLSADCIDGTKIEDDAIDSEHYTDGSIDLVHMSANSIDSDQYVDGSIDLAHMSANSVSTDQYVDGSIDSVHISTDLAGTGLTGGDGASLSVDGIVEVGASAELKVKVINIGDWDMDAVAFLDVAHGLTLANIRTISVLIKNDANNSYYPLDYPIASDDSGYFYVDATNVRVGRNIGGFFDNANFNTVPFNRGWITIWYVA